MKISFIIPVYQNAGSLAFTHRLIEELFVDSIKNYEREIIFVNDGSTDSSFEELKQIKEIDATIKILSMNKNFGQEPAITAGFKESTGDLIVSISADLQDPISLIPEMIEKFQEGTEAVIACRCNRHDSSFAKSCSKIGYRLLHVLEPQIPLGGFDFYCLSRRALDLLLQISAKQRFYQSDIFRLGFKIDCIYYDRQKRPVGKSTYKFYKKIGLFLTGILALSPSVLPRLILGGGVCMTLCSIPAALGTLILWLFEASFGFVWWSGMAVLLLFIGGIVVTALGLLGEYIWRIYEEQRDTPAYIIREKY